MKVFLSARALMQLDRIVRNPILIQHRLVYLWTGQRNYFRPVAFWVWLFTGFVLLSFLLLLLKLF